MQTIDSFNELILALDAASKEEVPTVLKRLNLSLSELQQRATWVNDGYTRNCIKRTDTYELILICWAAQSATPIHNHGGQSCWVYQLEGSLTEIRYDKNENDELVETNRMELAPQALTYMEDTMGYHQLCNMNNSRGHTLHLYASPIDECEVFNETKQCFETKEMTYDTLAGQPTVTM